MVPPPRPVRAVDGDLWEVLPTVMAIAAVSVGPVVTPDQLGDRLDEALGTHPTCTDLTPRQRLLVWQGIQTFRRVAHG